MSRTPGMSTGLPQEWHGRPGGREAVDGGVYVWNCVREEGLSGSVWVSGVR